MRYREKCCADLSKCCGDMAVFQFFKMAAVRHLGFVIRLFGPPTKSTLMVFVTVQNLVWIGVVVSIICKFYNASKNCGHKLEQELIRWDSERELFYEDIAHILQNTKKRELISLNKLDDSYRQLLRTKHWIYESFTKFPPCSYRIFIPWASRGTSADVYY